MGRDEQINGHGEAEFTQPVNSGFSVPPGSSYFPDWLVADETAGDSVADTAQVQHSRVDSKVSAARAVNTGQCQYQCRCQYQCPKQGEDEGRDRSDSASTAVPLDQDRAAQIVESMRSGHRLEAMGRGRILRAAADLYAHALRRRGQAAWELMASSAPWMIEDPAGEIPPAEVAERFGMPEGEVRRREQTVAWTMTNGDPEDIRRDIAAEIAVALMLPAGTARGVLEDALVLAGDRPNVLEALEAGTITWNHARTILREWRALVEHMPTGPSAATTLFEDQAEGSEPTAGEGADSVVLYCSPEQIIAQADRLTSDMMARAPHVTARQLGEYGYRRRAALGYAAQQRACAAARKQRDVWIEHSNDGVSYLHALLESGKASAIRDRIDRMARTVSCDQRGAGEVRADVLADLLLDAEPTERSGFPRGIRGQVSVTVPAELLAQCDPDILSDVSGTSGIDDALGTNRTSRASKTSNANCTPDAGPKTPSTGLKTPNVGLTADVNGASKTSFASAAGEDTLPAPELGGYGPIGMHEVLEIAASASGWQRLLTDRGRTQVLQYGRESYTVPAGLRRMLQVRDETCRFPGCRRSVRTSDVDHTVAWEDGGSTNSENLAHLCRHHHRIKHGARALGEWSVRQVPDTELAGDVLPGVTTAVGVVDHPWSAGCADTSGASGTGSRAGSPGDPGIAADMTGSVGAGVLEWQSPTGIVRRTLPSGSQPHAAAWLDDPPPF